MATEEITAKRDLDRRTYEVLGRSGEAKQKVGQLLSEMQTEYNLNLPKKTLRTYGIEGEKFKMTFKNSWWQCIVALLLFWPILIVLELIAVYALSALNLSLDADLQGDIRDGLTLLTLILIATVAHHLTYRSWKRKQLKLQKTF